MNKIGLVIQREFLSRVRKKSFIIMTILGPVLFAALMILPIWLATQGADEKAIQVIDKNGLFVEVFSDTTDQNYIYSADMELDVAKSELLEGKLDAILLIQASAGEEVPESILYSNGSPSLSMINTLQWKLRSALEEEKLKRSGLSKEIIDNLKVEVSISTFNLSEDGMEKASSSEAATAVGYISAFLIYMFIFIYGAMCMRGVIEEKSSRIIEVIISSVKPFQLMMGKVIGIASVGLAQFILWITLSIAIFNVVVNTFVEKGTATPPSMEMTNLPVQPTPTDDKMINDAFEAVANIDIPLVIFCFVFFFLGGYLLYGALFAAVGSSVDSDADAQQFMLPVTIPLILSIVSLAAIINDPDGSLAFWLSIIPFTSPVVMMMRVPFGVPGWELLLSIVLLVGGFVFTIWVAGRIYRVGILMHGTKVNYKVLAKWFMTDN